MDRKAPLKIIFAHRQLRWLFLWVFASRTMLLTPFFALFLAHRLGLGTAEITLLFGTYSATRMLSEVPMGTLADRLGEAPTLRLASLLMVLGNTLLVFGPLPALFFAQVLIALSESASSGTQDALLYRHCQDGKEKHEIAYADAQPVFHSFAWSGIVSAGVLGSLIAFWSLPSVGIAALLTAVATLVLSLLLHQPERATEAPKYMGRAFWELAIEIASAKALRFWFLLGSGINAILTVAYWTVQPLLNETGAAGTGNGLLYSAATFFAIFSSYHTQRLNRSFRSHRTALIAAIVVMIVSIVGLRFTSSLLGAFFAMAALRFAWGWLAATLMVSINEALRLDEMRATLLSMQSLVINFCAALLLTTFSVMGVNATAILVILAVLSALGLLAVVSSPSTEGAISDT